MCKPASWRQMIYFFALAIRTLLPIALLICVSPKDIYAQWTWAKPADWQASACRVTCPTGGGSSAAGSGSLIEVDGVKMVLTCGHVVEGPRGNAKFRDGTFVEGAWKTPAPSGYVDSGFDLAVLVLDDVKKVEHIPGLQIAEDDAKPGQQLEIMGFGGGKALFRPYYGRVTDADYGPGSIHQYLDCPVVHGDSGSTVVDEHGKVIGVQNVGTGDGFAGRTAEGTGYYRACGIAPLRPLISFVRRVRWKMTYGFDKQYPAQQGGCGPGGCAPQYGSPEPRNGGGLYPDQNQYPSRPGQTAPPSGEAKAPSPGDNSNGDGKPYTAPKPAEPPKTPELDYGKLADALVEKHADKLRGPAGPAGKDGAPGKDGANGKDADPAAIAAAVSKELPIDEIAKKAASMIDLDAIASRVVVNAPPQQPSLTKRHALVITERSKDYWTALSPVVDRAQTRYAGIKVQDKPNYEMGPMPYMIVFENGVSIQQYKGIDEVAEKLRLIAEGGSL